MTTTVDPRRQARMDQTAKRLAAMSHPKTRLCLLEYRDNGPIAPSEISERTGMVIGDVSYHTRKLLKLDCIELVSTEAVRGAVKSTYRATEQHLVDQEEWEDLDPADREGNLAEVFALMVDDFDRGLTGGKLGNDGRFHLTRSKLRAVDQEGFDELLAAHRRLFDESQEIAARSARRMAESAEESIQVSTSQSCFWIGTP